MSSDPQPTCLVCGRPIATAEQWETLPEGEGSHLCWSGADCGADIPALMGRLAEVTRERDEAQARVADLAALLPQAFDAGAAWCRGNHEDFKQIHPGRDEWVRSTLKKEVRDGE